MNRRNVYFSLIIILVILVAGGLLLFNWISNSSSAANGQTTSMPSDTSNAASPATSAPVAAAQNDMPTSIPPTGLTVASTDGALTTFQIAQDQSQASFTIYEVLRGSPNNVVGTTNQVTGQVELDPSDLTTAKVGAIKIAAQTLITDESLRNRSINNFILHTSQYPDITFTPQQITGLSGSATPGQGFQFKIAGNLTIQDVTKPVVFDVTAKEDSSTQISGSASSTIQRSDYNLNIPNIPFVANVGQDVKLELNFVLIPVQK